MQAVFACGECLAELKLSRAVLVVGHAVDTAAARHFLATLALQVQYNTFIVVVASASYRKTDSAYCIIYILLVERESIPCFP